jgi:hypothetical protein
MGGASLFAFLKTIQSGGRRQQARNILRGRADRQSATSRFSSLIKHDLFGKPLHTFPDHALM